MGQRGAERRGIRGWAVPGLFVLLALALTWPIVATPGQASSVREDYFSNLWNFWWVRTAFELGVSPWWTDHLHHPIGISLARHTLSPLNSIPGALLGAFLSPHATFDVLLLAHFALSGWTAFLLARFLTGSTRGSILAGLVYSFCPVHYYYLPQINVATTELLPLALLFLLRSYRDGGAGNAALAALCAAGLAASSSYYAVFAFLFAGLLAVAGGLWSPGTPRRSGARRVLAAAACAAAGVALVAWPLLAATLVGDAGQAALPVGRSGRGNDLLGYLWSGPPEQILVSWPTMLGYSTLALLVAGFRGAAGQRFWWLVGAVFWVLGLGASLHAAGTDTGIPLPYALLRELPVLRLLSKADRCMVMVQLVAAVLAAYAWRDLAARLPSPRAVRAVWLLVAAALSLELSAVPLRRFALSCPSSLEGLASAAGVHALVALPPGPGPFHDARYLYHQTCHGAKLAQGYTTNLTLTRQHLAEQRDWRSAWDALSRGDARPLVRRARTLGIDAIALYATAPVARGAGSVNGGILWAPFVTVARELVGARQAGGLVDAPLPPRERRAQRAALERSLGAPFAEDAEVVVFRVSR